MPSLFDKLQAKLELFRLEQRYTRNRHRRSTFISNAVYVDGEYVYQTPNTTGSSASSSSPRRQSLAEARPAEVAAEEPTPAQRKRLNRLSSMPGFGSSSSSKGGSQWRPDTVKVREVR